LLVVLRTADESSASGAFENSMIDALSAAMMTRRQVAATHDDDGSRITSLTIDPT